MTRQKIEDDIRLVEIPVEELTLSKRTLAPFAEERQEKVPVKDHVRIYLLIHQAISQGDDYTC